MGCGCNRGRGATAAGTGGTYRVLVKGRLVYESTVQSTADEIAAKYNKPNEVPIAEVIPPGKPLPA